MVCYTDEYEVTVTLVVILFCLRDNLGHRYFWLFCVLFIKLTVSFAESTYLIDRRYS